MGDTAPGDTSCPVRRALTWRWPTERSRSSVIGSAGEGYHTYGIGKGFSKDPPKPVFTVKTREGKQLLTGNLEYG